jgi:hypothetical protein
MSVRTGAFSASIGTRETCSARKLDAQSLLAELQSVAESELPWAP